MQAKRWTRCSEHCTDLCKESQFYATQTQIDHKNLKNLVSFWLGREESSLGVKFEEKNLQNFWVAKTLMSSYILCKIFELLSARRTNEFPVYRA